ncbi:MAG: hypothetical protein V1656_00870 [Candidatus Jorgensenbacteria bacterium]
MRISSAWARSSGVPMGNPVLCFHHGDGVLSRHLCEGGRNEKLAVDGVRRRLVAENIVGERVRAGGNKVGLRRFRFLHQLFDGAVGVQDDDSESFGVRHARRHYGGGAG